MSIDQELDWTQPWKPSSARDSHTAVQDQPAATFAPTELASTTSSVDASGSSASASGSDVAAATSEGTGSEAETSGSGSE